MSFIEFNRAISDAPLMEDWPDGRPTITERLVFFVALTGAPRTPTDISRLTGLRKTTVSSMITKLESRGLIQRARFIDDADQREVRVVPTWRARQMQARYNA